MSNIPGGNHCLHVSKASPLGCPQSFIGAPGRTAEQACSKCLKPAARKGEIPLRISLYANSGYLQVPNIMLESAMHTPGLAMGLDSGGSRRRVRLPRLAVINSTVKGSHRNRTIVCEAPRSSQGRCYAFTDTPICSE